MSMSNKSLEVISKTSNLSKLRTVFLTKTDILSLLEKEGIKAVKAIDVNADEYSAFWELNLWCAIFQDITGNDGTLLANRLRFVGISNAIREAEDTRLQIARDQRIESSFWGQIFNGQKYSRQISTLLGFARRMRLVGKAPSSEIPDFIAGNRKCMNHNKFPYDPSKKMSYEDWLTEHTFTPGFLLDLATEVIAVLFEDYEQDLGKFVLPPGATVEGAHTYLEKFKIVCDNQLWLKDHGVVFNYPLPYVKLREPKKFCRYQLVPKSFKSKRGIAPEPVPKQVLGYQIDSGMRKCLKRFGCDLSDQTKNQEFARDLTNATVDMSRASDSISLFLVKTIFRKLPNLLKQLLSVRSSYVLLENTCLENWRYATMGNAVTFVTETAIFLTIAIVSMMIQDGVKVTKKSIRRLVRKYAKLIATYGDDVVLPVKYYRTFCTILERFGFTVNTEKSFSDDCLYRESCGKEWYDGNDVTGTILSRGLSTVPLAELVSLQHKLVEYPAANNFLCSVILEVRPDITTSVIGSPYQDIWYDNPICTKVGCSPYAYFCTCVDVEVSITAIADRNNYGIIETTNYKKRGRLFLKKLNHLSNVDLTHKSQIGRYVSTDVKTPDTLIIEANDWEKNHTAVRGVITKIFPNTLRRELVKTEAPHDDNYEVHTMITSVAGGKVPMAEKEKVDLLAYLMTLGGGIEHVNDSVYTKDKNMIFDRRDLCHERKIKIENKKVVD